MEATQSGPYLFRLGLYEDPDLSPSNLGEAFDYYSAVPGWGWRAVVLPAKAAGPARAVTFGAGLGEVDYSPPEPESATDTYSPCGRLVPLSQGGFAFEGGLCLPPRALPGLGDEIALWVRVSDDAGVYGAELRCRLSENAGWDALEPQVVGVVGTVGPYPDREYWSPAEESPHHHVRPGYGEPERPGLPGELTPQLQRSLELARQEAERLRREEVGNDHLLIGLLREGSGQAARALIQLGVDLRLARAAEEFLNPVVAAHPPAHLGLSAAAGKALLLAADEARCLGESRLDTLHLLLGLLRQNGGAVDLLRWLGVPLDRLRHLLGFSGQI